MLSISWSGTGAPGRSRCQIEEGGVGLADHRGRHVRAELEGRDEGAGVEVSLVALEEVAALLKRSSASAATAPSIGPALVRTVPSRSISSSIGGGQTPRRVRRWRGGGEPCASIASCQALGVAPNGRAAAMAATSV
jgi:hypothetical protein